MTIFFRAFRTTSPLTPQQGQAGLLVKRAGAVSQLSLVQSATHIGEWTRDAGDDIYLDDEVSTHVNHANDPGTSALSMSQNATYVWDRPRSLADAFSLTDYAHASLEGYHPPGGSSGDPDLSKHSVIASENTSPGQPVYISSSNTVSLADASDPAKSTVIGLLLVGASANSVCVVLTEGSVLQSDWTDVIGTANLSPGAIYYLATTPGQLTETPPTGDGDTIVRVGVAITEQKLDIEVNEVAIL